MSGNRTWVLLTWVQPLIRLAKTRALAQEDVPPVGTGVSRWYSRFRRAWGAQRARGERASVTKTLVHTFWPTFIVVSLLKMIADAMVFVPPLLLKEITKVIPPPQELDFLAHSLPPPPATARFAIRVTLG